MADVKECTHGVLAQECPRCHLDRMIGRLVEENMTLRVALTRIECENTCDNGSYLAAIAREALANVDRRKESV